MAESKLTVKKTVSSIKKEANKPGVSEYVQQKFGPKALALINKYNLQTDESYKKLISSYERIDSLPKNDPRRPNLVDLWEGEFNRIFKHFWENYATGKKRKDSGISGWKDRLDVKTVSMSPDQKRKDLLAKVTPGAMGAIGQRRTTKDEILSRAGYVNQVKTEQFNFTATAKTGQNLYEIENILSAAAEEKGMAEPESMLRNTQESQVSPFKAERLSTSELNVDEVTKLMTSEAVPDPSLLEFINDGSNISSENVKLSSEKQEQIDNSQEVKEDKSEINQEKTQEQEESNQEGPNQSFIANENMSREEFNIANNIFYDENQVNNQDDNMAALELGTEFFQKHLTEDYMLMNNLHADFKNINKLNQYMSRDEKIVLEKRNIVSKEGFEISDNLFKSNSSNQTYEVSNEPKPKPYHEEKPVGYYPMNYDAAKRPAIHDLMVAHEKEGKSLDEMTQKLEFLRQLRDERQHRINMMKIERANSYIVTRARRLAEARELKRIKRRDEYNLKAIEKAERMRRLQERQKLIELMKERQMKRNEEKRVASILRLERERRMERDAKYKAEIASIDAQIRHEQEMIKRTELKMKAYFTKIHDDQLFEESLRKAKENVPNYKELEQKAELIEEIEEQKRKDRVEKISKKFVKNIK